MHNCYDCPISELFSNYPRDELLSLLIDIRGWFINYEYCFFGEENSGEANQLHLPIAQIYLIVFYGGIQTFFTLNIKYITFCTNYQS